MDMVRGRPALHKLAEEIDRDLRELRRILRRPVEEEAARLELTPPQRSVMQALFPLEGFSLKELSRQVGLAHSTVSGIVDRLEKKGLLMRQPDPNDGRFTRITVSARVQKYGHKKLAALAIQPLAQALKRATPAERKAIRQAVATLRRLVEPPPVRGWDNLQAKKRAKLQT
jgi:DNA-binding MarR family transcriptional regulator